MVYALRVVLKEPSVLKSKEWYISSLESKKGISHSFEIIKTWSSSFFTKSKKELSLFITFFVYKSAYDPNQIYT